MKKLLGKRFGKLVVIESLNARKNGKVVWRCLCDCGNTKDIVSSSLNENPNKGSKSCGCMIREKCIERSTKHGFSQRGNRDQTYKVYNYMLTRCYNPKNKRYDHYGGRGIRVTPRWLGENGFIQFLKDMGKVPKGKTLGRIDNDKDYFPDNCRWETVEEQIQNRSITKLNPEKVIYIRDNGHPSNLKSLARKFDVSLSTIRKVYYGYTWKISRKNRPERKPFRAKRL